jgi:hypothetical protein
VIVMLAYDIITAGAAIFTRAEQLLATLVLRCRTLGCGPLKSRTTAADRRGVAGPNRNHLTRCAVSSTTAFRPCDGPERD